MLFILYEDSIRWAVRLGRYSPEKVSGEPNGQLRKVRTLPLRVKGKSWLDWIPYREESSIERLA